MATLFVGDIHGCLEALHTVLARADFNPAKDTLWLTGDLVSRGPQTLETLRFIKQLGSAARVVLGNHDLHLLAVAAGVIPAHPGDRFDAILQADDRDQLLAWLRHQPLIQYHPDLSLLMVHAGVAPQWDLSTTIECAQAVERLLQSERSPQLLEMLYSTPPAQWTNLLSEEEVIHYSLYVFTMLRFCYGDGRLAPHCKLSPHQAPQLLRPWFTLKPHITQQIGTLVFGHWAALAGQTGLPNYLAMDRGCVWGGQLALLRWEDHRYFYVDCNHLPYAF